MPFPLHSWFSWESLGTELFLYYPSSEQGKGEGGLAGPDPVTGLRVNTKDRAVFTVYWEFFL